MSNFITPSTSNIMNDANILFLAESILKCQKRLAKIPALVWRNWSELSLPKPYTLEITAKDIMKQWEFLNEHGLWQNIVIDPYDTIIIGAKKFKEMKKTRPPRIPVVLLSNLSDKEKAACLEAHIQWGKYNG